MMHQPNIANETTNSHTKPQEIMSEIEMEDYMNALQKAGMRTTSFKDYDFNDYLYEEQESIVYGIMEKYTFEFVITNIAFQSSGKSRVLP